MNDESIKLAARAYANVLEPIDSNNALSVKAYQGFVDGAVWAFNNRGIRPPIGDTIKVVIDTIREHRKGYNEDKFPDDGESIYCSNARMIRFTCDALTHAIAQRLFEMAFRRDGKDE